MHRNRELMEMDVRTWRVNGGGDDARIWKISRDDVWK